MNVLVAYNSYEGHTRRAAEAIAAAVRALGYEAILKPVSEVRPADIQTAKALFIGTWVQGLILFGVRPSGAQQWVPALPPLEEKPTAVFCTYAFNPRSALHDLSAMLLKRGAAIQGEHAFHRSHPEEGAEQFVRSILEPVRV